MQSTSSKAFDQIGVIFADYIHGRRELRQGFARWLHVLGIAQKPQQHPEEEEAAPQDDVRELPKESDTAVEDSSISKKAGTIHSRIVTTSKSLLTVAAESSVDDYINEFNHQSDGLSGGSQSNSRLDCLLQMSAELQSTRLAVDSRILQHRESIAALRERVGQLKLELNPKPNPLRQKLSPLRITNRRHPTP